MAQLVFRQPRIQADQLPYPLLFRTETYSAGTRFAPHQHSWGELNYAVSGVMELKIAGKGFISPSHYAVWTPPDTVHDGYNSYETRHTSIYIQRDYCSRLPAQPCTLVISPLLRAILDDFHSREIQYPKTPEDLRLAEVLIDQICMAPKHSSYLPFSNHPKLKIVLNQMQKNPGDNRSLSDWAKLVHTTEKTLARSFQNEFGMSFGEWRQRLRLLYAINRLHKDESVQNIAFDLGYQTSSAFIAMFQRMTGMTPVAYAKTNGLK